MIVGFGHVARTGKDTAARALTRDRGYERRAFADALKELAYKADPIVSSGARPGNVGIGQGRLAHTVNGMGGWDVAKDSFPEVRAFLQRLGVAAREVFGRDIWIDTALKGLTPESKVVIPDVRFINEAEAIQALGGIVIRIDRPGHVAQGHISETELADWGGWDTTVKNNDTVILLEQRILTIVDDFNVARAEALVEAGE
jgi:hypothetical protein